MIFKRLGTTVVKCGHKQERLGIYFKFVVSCLLRLLFNVEIVTFLNVESYKIIDG